MLCKSRNSDITKEPSKLMKPLSHTMRPANGTSLASVDQYLLDQPKTKTAVMQENQKEKT